MSPTEFVIAGTLRPDGTLELDQRPTLPPGRVTVVLRKEIEVKSPTEKESWWRAMQRGRRELEASGTQFMNEAEVKAHLEWLRESDPVDILLQREPT